MKTILITVLVLLGLAGTVQSQSGKGVFNNFHIKSCVLISHSHPLSENYVYILQQNSRVVLSKEHYDEGIPLSIALLIPIGEKEQFNILINMSLADIANSEKFFNSRIPFGFGFAVFPFRKTPFLGFSTFCNISYAYRMRPESMEQQFFPISNYPGYNLAVGAPVPEEVIKPFCTRTTIYSMNGGIVLRF